VSTKEFGQFLREVGKRRVLTADEEKTIARMIRDGNKREKKLARDKLAEHNMKLVVSIAKPYARMGFLMEDLFQEGTIGLMKAVDRFDPERGFKFSTYAQWWIKQAVHRYMAGAGGNAIRVPSQLQRVRRQIRQRMQKTGETTAVAAEGLGIDMEEAIEAFDGPRATVSLDAAVSDDGSKDGRHAMIPDPNAVDPGELLPDHHVALRAAMNELTDRQKKVLELRFGFDGPTRARDDIAEELEVSNRVVQEEQKEALKVLNRVLARNDFTELGADVDTAELMAVFTAYAEADAQDEAEAADQPTCSRG
jgi:RNA polymerase sigma factor (sigma-70 family)